MTTRTTSSSRFRLPTRCLPVGDKGDGWRQLGQTHTWDEAERLRQDLAWVYRLGFDEIEILEIEDEESV
jgi:hypothetical protein